MQSRNPNQLPPGDLEIIGHVRINLGMGALRAKSGAYLNYFSRLAGICLCVQLVKERERCVEKLHLKGLHHVQGSVCARMCVRACVCAHVLKCHQKYAITSR